MGGVEGAGKGRERRLRLLVDVAEGGETLR